jgi:hypothetical protein
MRLPRNRYEWGWLGFRVAAVAAVILLVWLAVKL